MVVKEATLSASENLVYLRNYYILCIPAHNSLLYVAEYFNLCLYQKLGKSLYHLWQMIKTHGSTSFQQCDKLKSLGCGDIYTDLPYSINFLK